MATAALLPVKGLIIDLNNFRTVPQANEADAIHALVTIAPEKFWALMDSLLTNGYFLTENILVLRNGRRTEVREGNRRVAALKIILGYVSVPNLTIPSELEAKISALSPKWKKENERVPCAVYDSGEVSSAGRIVSLTHGKGEQAGRAQWNAVARARHNRSEGASEPSLDLLEKYLSTGKNLSQNEAELWAGDYHLSVLAEALQSVSPRLGFTTLRELAEKYPAVPKKSGLDDMLADIGRQTLDFPEIRNTSTDFAATRYKIPAVVAPSLGSASGATAPAGAAATGQPATGPAAGAPVPPPAAPVKKLKAVAVNDARGVRRTLRDFHPKGKHREKLVTLLTEARGLKLEKHPHSFCFLLRSMFELSAKAYCADHSSSGGPSCTKSNGEDRQLVDILNDVVIHLTKNKSDKAMLKVLHGALAELKKTHGFLSVTSMNQLIHNPAFVVDETHICNLFFNVFPLLDAMSK